MKKFLMLRRRSVSTLNEPRFLNRRKPNGLIFLVIIGLLSSFSFNSFSKELKIGYVDVFKVFNDYKKTKVYDRFLEDQRKAKEEKLGKKKSEIEQMEKSLSVLKDKEQEKQKEKMNAAIKDYQKLERETFLELKKQRDEKMKEIVEDMNKVIEAYAKKNDLDLVVNGNAVLYGDKQRDITGEILKRVNKKYKER